MKNAMVEMHGITKTFGNVVANDRISFSVAEGEIHALLGENGAGKSTLMNVLSGIYIPDSGSVFMRGETVSFSSPKDSIDAGIGMIHQHFKLVEVFTAYENIVLGREGGIFSGYRGNEEEIRKTAERFDLDVKLDKKVYDMSVGEKQNLEILKVLCRGAKVLILDEPTAVLTPQETEKLFRIMKKMKEQGCAVIFISHKMNEVMEIADRITILRKGRSIETLDKDKTNPKEMTDIMVGRAVNLSIERAVSSRQETVLKIKELNANDPSGIRMLKDVSFELRSGEILSVAGIAGSGQKELCEAIAGLYPIASGEIIFKGENIIGKTPKEIIKKGISMSFIPEDRLGMGLVASMDITDNLLLKHYQKQKGWLIDREPMRKKAGEIVRTLDIQTPGVDYPIRNLSGGNIQKVLLGRELDLHPELLITAYPVRGLDVNTSHKIYDLLNEEKKRNVAILYIGEDLDALLELSDRILVLSNGEITGIVNAAEVTKEEIGLMMLGEKIQKQAGSDD